MIEFRPYAGPHDLRRMQAVTAAAWAREKPRVLTHVGDIPWWLHQHTPDVADPKTIVRFERAGVDLAWAVLWQPQTCFIGIHPDARQAEVYDAVLGWFERAAGSPVDGGLDVPALESDRETIAELERRGYRLRTGEPWMDHRVRSLVEPVEEPALPEGYTLRHVAGEEDFERRANVHRAAFAPSRVTVESYRRTRARAARARARRLPRGDAAAAGAGRRHGARLLRQRLAGGVALRVGGAAGGRPPPRVPAAARGVGPPDGSGGPTTAYAVGAGCADAGAAAVAGGSLPPLSSRNGGYVSVISAAYATTR